MDTRIQDILTFGGNERVTDRALRCIAHALDFADKLGDSEFNSCHLLSGLLREHGGVAFAVLSRIGVTDSRIGDSLRNRARSVEGSFRVHLEIKTIFDVAFAVAGKMSHHYVGTEHLLISAACDGMQSAEMLIAIGIDPERVQMDVLELLGYSIAEL